MSPSKGPWVLALLALSTLVNYLDRQSLAVVVPLLRDQIGLTASAYGTISAAFLIAYGCGQLVAGPIVDRLGIRLGLSLFVAVWSLAAMLHGFAQSALHLLLLRILLGCSEAGNWPAGVKAIALWFPVGRRAFYLGIFDGGAAIGAMLAFPLMAGLSKVYGWRAAFLAVGALGLIWLILWLLVADDEQAPSRDEKREVLPGPSLLANSVLWSLMASRFFATPVWWFYIFWLPDYLSRGRGLSLEQIGLWGWLPYITVDLGKWIGGHYSDRLAVSPLGFIAARKRVMTVGALLMAGAAFVSGANSAPAAIAWVCVGTFGFGLWSVNILALHADSFPSTQLASAVGFTTASSALGGALFTWLTGRIVDAYGYTAAFTLTALLAVTAFLILQLTLASRRQAITS